MGVLVGTPHWWGLMGNDSHLGVLGTDGRWKLARDRVDGEGPFRGILEGVPKGGEMGCPHRWGISWGFDGESLRIGVHGDMGI
jgi:hypothetical protein